MLKTIGILLTLCVMVMGYRRDLSDHNEKICYGPNEFWDDCGCGENTCENPDSNIQCYACIPGCYCEKGYVRFEGVCILPEECPIQQQCGINEVWYYCHGGCEASCENPNITPWTCRACKQGCFCQEGYVRSNGVCILPEECDNQQQQPQCSINEEWYDCHGGCEANCEYPDRSPWTCRACLKGCFCSQGYVRSNGVCILPKECDNQQQQCGKNEEWDYCGCGENTCENPTSDIRCTACIPGCYCKKGYVRSNGVCILPEDCETQCGFNEKWYNCHGGCEPSCQNPDITPWTCYACMKGCFCDEGFVRNEYNMCVPPSWCDYYSNKRSGLRTDRRGKRGRRYRRGNRY